MSIIAKGLEKAGIEMVGDTLPKQHRGVKAFQRLIAAMRATEAEWDDMLRDSERQLNEALRQNLALQDRVHQLEAETLKHKLQTRLGQIDTLSVGDRTKILEIAA